MLYSSLFALSLAMAASAGPMMRRQNAVDLQNGQDAIAANARFQTLKDGDACQAGEVACVGNRFAQCVNGKLASQACAPGTSCFSLPNINSRGTSVTCDTTQGATARLAATGAVAGGNNNNAGNGNNQGGNGNNNAGNGNNNAGNGNNNAGNGGAAGGGNNQDPQTSTTLDPRVIAKGFAQNGQAVQQDGQVASLTSTNNFINFCLTVNAQITNGKQSNDSTCNPSPIGVIPNIDNMPSSKFIFPTNLATVPFNTSFNVQMAVNKFETGLFTNAQTNYFAAPQQLNGAGLIRGHTHIVIEKLESLQQTTPTNPRKFQFFKGVDNAAVNGVLTVNVSAGVPAGPYRMCSINTSMNHVPVVVPVAQHGALDDCVYFTSV